MLCLKSCHVDENIEWSSIVMLLQVLNVLRVQHRVVREIEWCVKVMKRVVAVENQDSRGS
jgi:hypothetical protein